MRHMTLRKSLLALLLTFAAGIYREHLPTFQLLLYNYSQKGNLK